MSDPGSFPFPHDEFVAGVRSERFRVQVKKYHLLNLAKLFSPASFLRHLVLTYSVFLLAAVFTFLAFRPSNYWFLLAIPLSVLDIMTFNGGLNLIDLLLYHPLPLLLAGGLLLFWWPEAGSAFLWMAGGFIVTRILTGMGLAMTYEDVLSRVTQSKEVFLWAYRRGMLEIYDGSDSWKSYEYGGAAK